MVTRAITSSAEAHWQPLDEREVTCSDDHMRFDLKTKASPGQVLRALTDFTVVRLQIWNRTLDPKTYELRDSGETWAVARESSPRSPFWVVVRYPLRTCRQPPPDETSAVPATWPPSSTGASPRSRAPAQVRSPRSQAFQKRSTTIPSGGSTWQSDPS